MVLIGTLIVYLKDRLGLLGGTSSSFRAFQTGLNGFFTNGFRTFFVHKEVLQHIFFLGTL